MLPNNEEIRKVEWGSTWGEVIDTQIRVDGAYTNVDADSYSAQLETYDTQPAKVADLSCTKVGTGEYVMWFYADTSLYDPLSNYYLAFTWVYGGKTQIKRVPVRIEVGVK
jgi:hypothetical protein